MFSSCAHHIMEQCVSCDFFAPFSIHSRKCLRLLAKSKIALILSQIQGRIALNAAAVDLSQKGSARSPRCARRRDRKTHMWLLPSLLESGNWATLDRSFRATENPPFLPGLQRSETRSLLTEERKYQISPKGSHESNGAAERTVQQVRSMARVSLEHVRKKTGSEFSPHSP